jgi:uncharacterized membrane protein
MYQWLLYVHILAAVVWVGGAVFVQVLAVRVMRSSDPTELPVLARHVEALGTFLFMPAALLILLSGAAMTIQAWNFGQGWIVAAIALWVLSAVAGALYLGPRSKRAARLFESEGPTSPEAISLVKRMFLVSRLELLSFAVVIGLMVFKPTV